MASLMQRETFRFRNGLSAICGGALGRMATLRQWIDIPGGSMIS
jgi:hypothetical protein